MTQNLVFKNVKQIVIMTLSSVLVVGCNTTPQMQVNKPSLFTEKVSLAPEEIKATFALEKLVSDIDRGDQIFAFPGKATTKGNMCNETLGRTGIVTASSGRQYLGNWDSELGEVFYDELTAMGFSIAGVSKELFAQASAVNSAELMVGARLTRMSGNFCMEHDVWYGLPLPYYSGELATTFDWSVLNTPTKEVILTTETTGYFKLDKPEQNGILTVFENAFADAVQRLGANKNFQKLALGEKLNTNNNEIISTSEFQIKNGLSGELFDIEKIRSLVVTIRIGSSHGPGFFVGEDGYLLTNAHVVGDAKSVQVITALGNEIEGKVVVSNKMRDVALIKVPMRIANPNHIQVTKPKISSTVYAVGTPIDETMKTTVTRGVLSAYRTDSVTGLKYYQSDVAISPGNSGGPLFNEKGEIVGVSVVKWVGVAVEGLGLFIPIDEALEALNITVSD